MEESSELEKLPKMITGILKIVLSSALIALAIKLLQFEEAVQTVGKEGTPHVLCAYLYELAGVFSSFYEHCPILNAEDENVKLSRLKLASLTEKTLKQGLELLGIKTIEKM